MFSLQMLICNIVVSNILLFFLYVVRSHAYECGGTFELSLDPSNANDDFKDVIEHGFGDTFANIVDAIGLPPNPTFKEVLDDDNINKYLPSCTNYSQEQ